MHPVITSSLTSLDLRTTDHERVDIQNLARIDALKRIAETNAARFGAANNLSSLQNSLRDSFIAGGPNFNNIPLTAPLGIPASDLARIAVQVPDPAGNGEATSGTGKLGANLKFKDRSLSCCCRN